MKIKKKEIFSSDFCATFVKGYKDVNSQYDWYL